MTGYLHSYYAKSLSEFGTPRELRRCGGWILQRQIPDFPHHDAMGCYPLFACRDWSQLHADLDELQNEIISLALVADPFGKYDLDCLYKCFDVVIPFKEHFVVDLQQPIKIIGSKNKRRCARKSLRNVHVEICSEPMHLIDEWMKLYENMIKRQNLRGIQAFSKRAFTKQLSIPGVVMFRAIYQGSTVGLDWYYEQGEVVYGHLVALSPICYRLRVSYALLWSAIEYFVGKKRWLNLGAGPGVVSDPNDGLSLFKRGWSSGTRTAYFCGRIFNREKYLEIVCAKNMSATQYFPAYRKGEFC